jgi:hypothetical protein
MPAGFHGTTSEPGSGITVEARSDAATARVLGKVMAL